MNLEELKKICENCHNCKLGDTRKHMVFGEGREDAKIMFVGEGPGRQEDETGKPFVGKAGQVLNQLLEESGLSRDDIYIANIVKCRPPQNRDPKPEEKEACINYLKYQMYLIKPKIVVCLGRIAAMRIIEPNFKITRQHGQWVERKGYYLIATYHPAALLRDESKMSASREDFQKIHKRFLEVSD